MSPLRYFSRKKEPHFSSVRSVITVDAPEGRVASVAIKIACDLLDFQVLKELKYSDNLNRYLKTR